MILVIDNYDSFTWNLVHYLMELGAEVEVVRNDDMSAGQALSSGAEAFLISPGPKTPNEAGVSLELVAACAEAGKPLLGICLGHQMLALALGAKTVKMNHGHHGANHPVKDLESGKVEITSMNHGFTVDSQTLPAGVIETHVSLFDGSNCGIRMADRPVFSVQYHPEASPGPQDSFHLFERFAQATQARAAG